MDVFSEWLDDCEAAAQGKQTNPAAGAAPRYESSDESDSELPAASGLSQKPKAAAAPAADARPSYTDLGLDDSDDDSDDEEAILLEYERVKKEREERERQEIKERVEQEGEVGQGYSLQKKWFQETVFQNQSLKEKKEKPEFCNDTVRSKFHKKVLHKFVWT